MIYILKKKNNLGLASLRLAIVDASKKGNQPTHSFSGRFVMVYNGEIYNYLELRQIIEQKFKKYKKKFIWKNSTDSEVLVNGIEIFGIKKMLKMCEGMFAFSIWDKKENKLIIGRDRIGEKPLYYGIQNNIFFFTSDLLTFQKNKLFKFEINKKAANIFVKYGFIPSPLSIYKNVFKLEPSTILEVDKNLKVSRYNYYDLKKELFKKSIYKSNIEENNDTIDSTNKLLQSKIKNMLSNDFKVGCFLSGGIDSALVASIAQTVSKKKIETFTLKTSSKNYDESISAKKISQFLGTNHNTYKVKKKDIMSYVNNMHNYYSEPFGDSSQIPSFLLSKFAKKKIKIVLTGDGGDEISGGYNRYLYFKQYHNFLNKNTFSKILLKLSIPIIYKLNKFINLNFLNVWNLNSKLKKLESIINIKSFSNYYDASISQGGYDDKYLKSPGFINNKKYIDRKKHTFKDLMYLDLKLYFPEDILCKMDRASMYHSIENRTPFANHKIIEHFFKLPSELLINKFKPKFILKKILGLYLPKDHISNVKKGFSIPMSYFLKKYLNTWGDKVLNIKNLNKHDLFDNEYLILKWTNFKKDKDDINYHQLWNILVLQNWINKH
ncbi:MAG: asparagine synthase (glutamine-hydrolyzing) [Euryarchaeota archaeon]|nr:asparagine synthase (glutamine-hydrolyzing) [Euryarchaeota archaeon]OUU06874.1 MAG: asparagine synthase (glutamine-hydrolyzing) [Gammaproteobacteria bacterium TMED34]